MKATLAAVMLLMLAGCTTRTSGGQCVGVLDKKAPGVEYDTSIWNIALGVIFSETLIVPAFVLLKDLECPVPK